MRDRLPLTVISGYLGAGKTTLINRVLAEAHGLKLLIMVNDFGAINIDAALLESQTEDTLTLTNGCVCCTMGADLFLAIGDVLDRDTRPDHLIIEASGVADPAKIAQVAQTEPELVYGGIVTVVDASGYGALCKDQRIGPQVAGQVRAADLICVSKAATDHAALMLQLRAASGAAVIDLALMPDIAPLLLGSRPPVVPQTQLAPHLAYRSWHDMDGRAYEYAELTAKLADRPSGILRFKGFVARDAARAWEVHCVGPTVSIKALPFAHPTEVVAIGLAEDIDLGEMSAWWDS